MAIQIPNPGTGNGATGDNEFVLWTKVKDNFSDQTNAASKLVGAVIGKIPLFEQTAQGTYSAVPVRAETKDCNTFEVGSLYYVTITAVNAPPAFGSNPCNIVTTAGINSNIKHQFATSTAVGTAMMSYRFSSSQGVWGAWTNFYSTSNTTKDSNGFIKAASPIVRVFADKVELNEEAVGQNVTYKRNGVGDYTITTVSGLSTDGWYIELPKDMNGNPKVAVTLQETNGVIILKSYKRIFSMETFTFEPDLNEPLDIPDGRWIDLRLNEIPVEPSEPESEV